MRIALIAAISLIPLSQAASLTGSVVNATGASIAKANVELNSGAQKYQTRTDDAGVFQFLDLPAGKYTLSFSVIGFKRFTLRSVDLAEGEKKQIPEVPLDVGNGCGSPFRDLVLLPSGDSFGRLSGSVSPSAKGVEVTLVCRTFTPCRSTNTDSKGHFSFDMISSGFYGLN
ncbi:MAG TPA: carboxypeptidase-like regulatory domain-containing protein, partial [Bryobacteraceae bacterium]|nr:carboxypeptidase-like regulatory domain-containing protein [Bryobacteraceae bacterium]